MLIVEGTDLVGKTTFCRKLLEHLPAHIYAHFSRLPPQFDYYWGYVDRMSRHVVQDRFHMSELAYAWARGEEPHISPEQYRLIDAELRRLGAYTVLVVVDDRALLKDRMRVGEMYDFDTICKANDRFCGLWDGEFGNHYIVDIDYTARCSSTKPFPNEDDVTNVLAAYRARQLLIDELNHTQRRTARKGL